MFYVCLSVISLVVLTYVDRKVGSVQVSAKLVTHPSTNCELADGCVTNLALSRASVPYLLDTRSVMWLMCDLAQTRACGKLTCRSSSRILRTALTVSVSAVCDLIYQPVCVYAVYSNQQNSIRFTHLIDITLTNIYHCD